MKTIEIFTRGFIKENPVLVLALGLCPALAVTSTVENGLGMGLSSTAVMIGSNTIVSLLKKFIPSNIRIPIYIVVIATFVTLIDLTLQAYIPALSESLGLFIPLIVVNCMILGRAEAFASKNSLFQSVVDAIGMGLGFTFALVVISAVREVTGSGAIFGLPIFQMMSGIEFNGALMMILPPGGFLAMGLVLAFMNWNKIRKQKKQIEGGK